MRTLGDRQGRMEEYVKLRVTTVVRSSVKRL